MTRNAAAKLVVKLSALNRTERKALKSLTNKECICYKL